MNLRLEPSSDNILDLSAMLHLMPEQFDHALASEFARGFYSGGCIAFGLALASLLILSFRKVTK